MVLINYATKEIVAKVVYYGPALCGKTTNLQVIYTRLNPKKRGKMISLATESDRTLFFDFLPMELGTVQGFKVRFQLYTVPGQVRYGATRKLVLKGADAVVFVADSQETLLEMNREAIEDMKQNMLENGLDPDGIPLVLQYNKRDLDGIMEVEDLDKELNWRGVPTFEAVAVNGPGVMETLLEITRLLIKDMKKKHSNINTDKIKDLKMDAFLPEEEEEIEAEEVMFEIDHGYGNETDGADVEAGELLDQIETINMDSASQAEHFFDNVRKGNTTEEAVERAINVSPMEDGEPEFIDLDNNVTVYEGHELEGVDVPVGEHEFSPEEIGAAEESFMELDPIIEPVKDEPAAPEPGSAALELEPEPAGFGLEPVPPAAEPELAPAPKPKAQSKPKPRQKPKPPPPPPPPSFEPEDESIFGGDTVGGGDIFSGGGSGAGLDLSAPAPQAAFRQADFSGLETRLDEIKDALARLEKEVGVLGRVAASASGAGQKVPAAVSGDMTLPPAVEIVISKLGESMERIEQEVSGLRLTMALAKEQGGGSGGGGGVSSGVLNEMLDTLKNEFMGALEGQDKLLLKVIETVRESRQAAQDGQERQEDALKYIIDKISGTAGEEGGKQSKKKWF